MTRYYALVLVSGGAHTPEEEACEAAAEFLFRIPTPFEHLKWRIDKGMGGQRVDTPACWVWQGPSKIGTDFEVRKPKQYPRGGYATRFATNIG